jgi:hypothetical protein
MAAAQLTSASNCPLTERLRTIASSAHWRHVFRIAASKIFSVAELGHYRNDVVAICHSLDNGDLGEDQRLIRAGAKLALELLVDGISNSAPRFGKSLLRRSLGVLDLGAESVTSSLLNQFGPETQDIYREEMLSRLQHAASTPAQGAIGLALLGAQQRLPLMESILSAQGMSDPTTVLNVFRDICRANGLLRRAPSAEVLRVIRQAQWDVGPAKSFQFSRIAHVDPLDPDETHDSPSEVALQQLVVAPPIFWSYRARRTFSVNLLGEHGGLLVGLMPVKKRPVLNWHVPPRSRGDWQIYEPVAEFYEDPCCRTLSRALAAVADNPNLVTSSLPWILSTLVQEHREGAPLEQLVHEISTGQYGDWGDWYAAERRWRSWYSPGRIHALE